MQPILGLGRRLNSIYLQDIPLNRYEILYERLHERLYERMYEIVYDVHLSYIRQTTLDTVYIRLVYNCFFSYFYNLFTGQMCSV